MERNIYIIYLEDNNTKKQGFFKLLEINQSYIVFIDLSNKKITLPLHRLLKMKEKYIEEEINE